MDRFPYIPDGYVGPAYLSARRFRPFIEKNSSDAEFVASEKGDDFWLTPLGPDIQGIFRFP